MRAYLDANVGFRAVTSFSGRSVLFFLSFLSVIDRNGEFLMLCSLCERVHSRLIYEVGIQTFVWMIVYQTIVVC